MNEERFDELFKEFTTSSGGSNIKEVYKILPYLKNDEIVIISDLFFFVNRYELNELKLYLKNYLDYKKYNRHIGFMPNIKNLLKYMTLEEKFRGYKVDTSGGDEK